MIKNYKHVTDFKINKDQCFEKIGIDKDQLFLMLANDTRDGVKIYSKKPFIAYVLSKNGNTDFFWSKEVA